MYVNQVHMLLITLETNQTLTDDESRVFHMIGSHFLEPPNSPLLGLKRSGCEGIWGP